MNKSGKYQFSWMHLIGILVVGYILNVGGLQDKYPLPGGAAEDQPSGAGASGGASLCPTDGDTTLVVDVRNKLNTTGTEEYDTTVYVYDSSGSLDVTLTDTTNPAGTNVNCGDKYTIKMVASDADNGDNSGFEGLDYPKNKDSVKYDAATKTISFDALESTTSIGAQGEQHGLLKFKIYDNDGAAWTFDSQDTSATNYENAATTWNSSTTGTLGYTLTTASDILNLDYKVTGNSTDTDFAAHYVLVAVEAPLTEYNAPTVAWDGKALSDIKLTGLNGEEARALSRYEYIYKIDGQIEDVVHSLNFQIYALNGQNPSTDIEVDFYSAGAYLSVDGNTVKVGTHRDDSANTATYTVQDTTVLIV